MRKFVFLALIIAFAALPMAACKGDTITTNTSSSGGNGDPSKPLKFKALPSSDGVGGVTVSFDIDNVVGQAWIVVVWGDGSSTTYAGSSQTGFHSYAFFDHGIVYHCVATATDDGRESGEQSSIYTFDVVPWS